MRLGKSFRRLEAELLRVLVGEALPAADFHGVGADEAADRGAGQKAIENVEADVPSGGAHRDEAAIDGGPEREARAVGGGFEFPAHRVGAPGVFEEMGLVGSNDGW